MDTQLQSKIAAVLDSPIKSAQPLSGGDINEAYKIALANGMTLFVKANANAPTNMFTTEGRGLAWLREANAIRVPEVIAIGDDFLALEMIAPTRRAASYDDELGRQLATLHRHGAKQFGLDHDNFIGRLPQQNRPEETWAAFYRDRRLQPQLELAVRSGRATDKLRDRLDRLYRVLEERIGPSEPPARLHGDLWSGNVHTDENGQPCLIDPAVYGGHREVDLAMLELFGSISNRTLAAYEEVWPLPGGWRERIPLYQLYPLMVHLNLFGGHYISSCERVLARIL